MTRWPSPAKLNLFLYITGQRADGYHTLQTLFQFLDYGDTLTIEPRDDGQLRLLTPVDGVPDEENLIIRAARLLMQAAAQAGKLPAGSGADISIDKVLPMGGGLGGGFNAGAEMVDCLIVLNSRAAVRTFMSSGSLQLGGNLALAVGPLGRSGEASAALNAEMKMSAGAPFMICWASVFDPA